MTVYEVLKRLGFLDNEIKVYLALIDSGVSLAGNIAKKSNLHRRQVYDALNRLTHKGLVSYAIKSGKKLFKPTHPGRILEIVKERENEIQEILPELEKRFETTKQSIFAEIYEGAEGLKSVMEMILKERKEWLTIGSTGKAPSILPYYLEQFARKRLKLGIKRKVLIADTKEGREYYKVLKKQGLIQIRFLPKEIQQPQTIWIFGSKVAIILVSLENLVVFLIDNKETAHSYREYFNLLWKKV
jgi:sugar-specific transcriptional regulator TrmB